MPTGLLLMLHAPQRFKATYCSGEIYVAEVESNTASKAAQPKLASARLSRRPAAS